MDRRWYVMRSVWLLSVQIGLLLWVSLSQAQTTSITSSGLGTKVTLNGAAPVPTYDITGGTRPGNGTNLFHSFGDFSVGTHDIARFGNDSGLLTTNILSRVTGGQPSNIFGTVQTAGFGTAALWLINPAGIVFGPTASLNVGGSVHFSTADYLRLGSGNDRFYADLGKTSQLTSAPVTAFGFLGERPAGPITVQAGNPLAVSEGKAISLIGGDISITGRTLSAPGGQINVASVKSAAEAFLNPVGQSPGLDVVASGQTRSGTQPTTAEGTVLIRGGALVGTVTLGNNAVLKADAVSGGKAGNIDIEAKTLNITPGTLISAATREATIDGNSLIISASDHVSMSGASIFSRTTDSGDTGNISITAPALSMDSAASISVNTTARGTAGAITIGVDLLTMTNGGALSSTSSSLGGAAGSGGQILIQGRSGEGSYAQSVNLDNSTISTSANAGPGGAIEIKAGNIDLRNGTTVSATTQGINNAGNIMLTSDDNIVITNSTVSTSATQATGGNIILTAPNMVWLNGGALQSDITDANTAGTGGGIHIQANDVRVEAAATITASLSCTAGSSCAGKAGDISIMAGSLSINSGAALSANTRGQGNAGNISITASDLVTIYGSGSKLATETTAGGAAGAITMNVNQLTMTNGGEISSTSRSLGGSAGSGGQILIQGQGGKGTYSQSVSLDKSSIKTSANAGPGGTIEIRGSNIELRNGSNVKASTLGTNDAGGITLTSSDNIAITNSTVETSAIRGSGGNITLTAPDTIRVTNAQLTSSVGGSSESDAGNIRINTIHPQFVIVSNSEISANANEGKGGNIFIIPQYQVIQGNTRLLAKAGAGIGGKIDVIASRAVLIEPGSELNASAGPAGIDGQVNIQAPIQQLAGAIAPLPQAFAVATNLYGQRCAAEKGGQFSSFVQGARDGVPPQPGDLMMSPVLDFDETTTWLVPERGSSLSEVSSIAGNKATEALVNIRNVSPTHLQLWPEDRAGVFHVSDACQ